MDVWFDLNSLPARCAETAWTVSSRISAGISEKEKGRKGRKGEPETEKKTAADSFAVRHGTRWMTRGPGGTRAVGLVPARAAPRWNQHAALGKCPQGRRRNHSPFWAARLAPPGKFLPPPALSSPKKTSPSVVSEADDRLRLSGSLPVLFRFPLSPFSPLLLFRIPILPPVPAGVVVLPEGSVAERTNA